jgi:glycosyltransferase involved in cell wall biosynthesis
MGNHIPKQIKFHFMKVLYTGTLDVNAGGPAFSTYNTMRGLNAIGVETHVLMYEMGVGGKLIGNDVPVHFAKKPIEHSFCYSPYYKVEIISCGDFDIYQAQGVWQYNTYALVDVARKRGKPYIITPRGMLYPQDIAKSKSWFKKMSLKIRLLDDLNRAACVHVTCEDEMNHCRNLGVTSPIAIVPNPVEIKEYPNAKKDDVFRLGYLGRISRRKNVEGLIYAWSELGDKVKENAELLIIGGGDEEYMAFLKNEVARLNLSNVRFTGFISGQEKEDSLSSLSVLAMPSEFENFGNVIVEGLVRGIPCIATTGAPWKDLEDYQCGWWVEYNQTAITKAVQSALETSVDELYAMGVRGKKLMKDKYSIEAVAKQMKEVYEWLLGNHEKPDFVHC